MGQHEISKIVSNSLIIYVCLGVVKMAGMPGILIMQVKVDKYNMMY